MNTNKKEYRNATRSKRLIKDALLKLITSRADISDVTVTDIVNEAGINRGTFYNHYSNISDVVNDIEKDMMLTLTDLLNHAKKDADPLSSFLSIIGTYLKKNDALLKSIIRCIPRYVFDNLKHNLLQAIETQVIPLFKITPAGDSHIKFYIMANGFAGTYVDYLEGNLNTNIDELLMSAKDIFLQTVGNKYIAK